MNREQELEQLITKYSQAYYGEGESLISDENFDLLVQELKILNPNSLILKKTSTGFENNTPHLVKIKHPFYVGSLEKLKWKDILTGSSWPVTKKIIASLKIDGGSGTAHYSTEGKLIQVLSRGNGEIGLDITQNVVKSGTLPLSIAPTGRLEVIRGELAITWEDFEKYLSEKSHPRNAACGLSQSKYAEESELTLIKFVTYHRFNSDQTKLEMLRWLTNQNFLVAPYTVFESFSDFKHAVVVGSYDIAMENKLTNSARTKGLGSLPYDGTVLTEDDDPENSLAIKFEEESAVTTLREFEWTISRTGRAVPVALLEPINLAGATISRAICNNVDWLQEMRLTPGCKVKIVRANEIIPKITAQIEIGDSNWLPPTHCPLCGEPLQKLGRDLSCQNDLCRCRVMAYIDRVFMNCAVDGIGPTIAEQFYSAFKVVDLPSLKVAIMEVTNSELLEIFGPSTSEKLRQMIDKLKTWSPYPGSYLWMANIPRFGDKAAEKFNENVSVEEFRQILVTSDNLKIKQLSTYAFDYLEFTSEQLIRRYWNRLLELYTFFEGRIKEFQKSEKPKTQVKFSLTGSLSKTRDEIVAEFAKFGCEFVATSKASIFICNKASSSAKYQEAVKKGLPILTEAEFRAKYIS